MKARFEEYDKEWLYDTQKDVLYKIIDKNECEPCKINIVQLSKFCPMARLTNSYHINPYKIWNAMDINNEF